MSNPALSKVYCVYCEFFKPSEHLFNADGYCSIYPPTITTDKDGGYVDSIYPEVKLKSFCGLGVQKPRVN